MDRKKMTKRTAGVAAAAALTLTATGAAYAATDGSLPQILEHITLYINGEAADIKDYNLITDEDGNQQFVIPAVDDEDNAVTVTLNPESGDILPDVEYSIDIDKDGLAAEAGKMPFTLESENSRLILVEADGSRLDITEAAASEKGCPYAWTDEEGNGQEVIVFGTPEEYAISSPVSAVEISPDNAFAGAVSANIAVEK